LSALKGRALEDYLVNNLSSLFPDLSLVSKHEKRADQGFDIHARNSSGTDYFFEIKSTECNRLNIGQIIEYKAKLAENFPDAKIILICKNVDTSIKKIVKQIGVEIWTFSDLGIFESSIKNIEEKKEIKLSPTEQKAYFALLKRGLILAKTDNLSSILGISPVWAKNILSHLAKKGVAQRIGRGKYVVIPADVIYGRKSYVGDPLILISQLLRETDYYIAYYSAAQIHGLTEQMPFRTIVAVLRQLRSIRTGNLSINFVKLQKSKFFGIEETKYSDDVLKVSDIEKTLIDCIDRPELCGGLPEVARIILNALEQKKVTYQRLILYLKRFGSYAVIQRMGVIIELITEKNAAIQVPPEVITELTTMVGSKIYPLDVKGSKKGQISKKWKINNNAGYLEI